MKGEMIPGDEREMAAALIGKLKEMHVTVGAGSQTAPTDRTHIKTKKP